MTIIGIIVGICIIVGGIATGIYCYAQDEIVLWWLLGFGEFIIGFVAWCMFAKHMVEESR